MKLSANRAVQVLLRVHVDVVPARVLDDGVDRLRLQARDAPLLGVSRTERDDDRTALPRPRLVDVRRQQPVETTYRQRPAGLAGLGVHPDDGRARTFRRSFLRD